ncbi:MAG: alpha/beta hydrolase, partial [Gammaproteobacteria bacterium]|nr:alpha/beta hydrolase [Gammaproteobacteria bacterium]
EQDPIHQGHRLLDLANAFRESGNRFVDVKLYPDMRHEPLNEKNSQRVMQDIIEWIQHNTRLD